MVTAWETAGSVPDPELPALTIADLGILRDVRERNGAVTVTITPTYSGCPAMAQIAADLRRSLAAAGYERVDIRTELSPPWTTDWITPDGRRKLLEAGIAPPEADPRPRQPTSGPVDCAIDTSRAGRLRNPQGWSAPVACPRCGSGETRELSRFSGTACKALYQCRACLEPFEHVKEH
jgi:ring-1,2-phenylacetyl-CoA epoxidase subunit PaaD